MQPALHHRQGPTGGVMMNLADQKELSELFLKAGPT